MGADTFVTNGATGKRATRRARVLLAAKLQTSLGEIDCRLRDLSRKGALIECAQQPPVGSEVTFVRGSTIVPARVAWTGAGRVGLEFVFMIDEQEVLVQLKRKSSNNTYERFRRPGLNEDLSEDARKLAREWGVTVGLTLPSD
jgi:hypothetical protein